MKVNRRLFVSGLIAAGASAHLHSQQSGVASRGLTPQPRRQPSGRPFSTFVDIGKQAGLLAPVVYGAPDHKEYILEAVGCGCAFLDYDNDGWMDIFVLGGTTLAGAPPDATNRLYKNNRDGTFLDVTESAGLHYAGWAYGVCVGDYNNDGYEDIFCTYWGENKLYRNNGNGTFTDVTKSSGLSTAEQRWGAGCSFFDYDRDGHLDLFVSNYVDFDFRTVPKPSENPICNYQGIPVNCGPRGLKPGHHSLYRNNGDGTFTDVSKEAGIAGFNGSYGLTVVTADLDEDGWPDVLVACDSTPSLLFMNNHDGTFRQEAVIRGLAFSGDGAEQAGMGLGVGDYNLDGHSDILRTHFQGDLTGLFRNDGKGYFDDVSMAAGMGVETRFVCWGAGIVDLDNDGYPDIFVTSGGIYPEVASKFPSIADKSPRLVFRNLGNGTFEELFAGSASGLGGFHSSRGCAFGDFDNDGDLDVMIVNLNEPPSLLRNDCLSMNHWIKVKLIGSKSNRSAIGARVIARYGKHVQSQELLSQSSFLSSNDPRLHFGLGQESIVDLDIHWPSGANTKFKSLRADQLVTIREDAGIVAGPVFRKS